MPAGLTVLIPAYNESGHIVQTIRALKSSSLINDILVIDDASEDDTAKQALRQQARVLRLSKNRGKGGAINAAYPFIRDELVLLLDADLGASAVCALALAQPVLAGETDIAIAGFPRGKGGKGFGFVKKTAAFGIRYLTGCELSNPLSGQRCLRKKVLGDLLPLAEGFGLEVGMSIDALKKGYRLMEIELNLFHCPPGRNLQGFLHRGRQFLDVCSVLRRRMCVRR